MPVAELSTIWMDGALVPWDEARVHLLNASLHYGWGVFEGLRAYETDRGAAVFQHRAHMERLHRSAAVLHMDLPYPVEDLMQATRELIRTNGVASCYVRPIAYLASGEMGLNPLDAGVRVAIAAWPWGGALGEGAVRDGVRAKTSSWVRVGTNMIPTGVKACGAYVNSSLAKAEAVRAGYDEAVLLDEHGHVAEGSGQNIFAVAGGVLSTPPLSDRVLRGITRDSVIEFATTLGIEVCERTLLRQDLYTADEAFYAGTAAEVVPIRSLDDRDIGGPGPVTRKLQETFFAAVSGRDPRFEHMLDHVRTTTTDHPPAEEATTG